MSSLLCAWYHDRSDTLFYVLYEFHFCKVFHQTRVDMYQRIRWEIIFFPGCVILESSQGFLSDVGKTESCHAKEEGVVGPASPGTANVQGRVKDGIRTYSWCQPRHFSRRDGMVLLPPIVSGALQREPHKAPGASASAMQVVARWLFWYQKLLADVGRCLLCLCLHPTRSAFCSTTTTRTCHGFFNTLSCFIL